MSQQGMFLAKALFDNIAETPDELAFRRGDVLTVVEQDTSGLDGWWLCSLRGKSGIAPGNRLKILSGMGDGMDNANKSGMDLYDQPNRSLQDYDVPPSNRGSIDKGFSGRRPSHDTGRRSIDSRKASLGDDLYDTPPSSKRGSAETANGIYDTPPSSKRASSERTPPHSNRSSASRDSGSNLLSANSPSQLSLNQHSSSNLSLPTVIKRRSGSQSSENCYETPPGSNRSSLERILSEEGPPIYETLSPSGSTEHLDKEEPTYDTPPSRSHVLSQANPASLSSLRSVGSSESLLSNTSGVSSARLSQTNSLPDSARSSMDLPAETYDVPPSAQEADQSRKQLSVDSGLGFYDSPIKSRPSSSNSNTLTSSDGIKTSQSSFDCKPSPSTKDIKRSKSLEHALDDLYDTPKNNAPKVALKKFGAPGGYGSSTALSDTSGLYDIPPQVTRDSVISMRSDSSDENQRLSSSSLDIDQHLSDLPVCIELFLDQDSALEVLTKRQQDVSKATSRLGSFVNSTWRSRASLEKTLYDIKVSCSLVRNSLTDFVDFARGAMANAVKVDRQLASKLQKYVAPLQSTLDFVNKSFNNLEELKWQVSSLSEPLDKSKPDDLGQIALVAKDLLPEVKKAASFIQSNGSTLFRKASSGDSKKPSVSSKPPIVPKPGDGNGGRPGYGYGKQKNMQHRPLPAVPGSDKRLPGVATVGSALAEKPKLSIYDIKAALHKDDYAECDELPEEKDPEKAHKEVMEHCVQEYDYVQLDSGDSNTLTRSHSKNNVGVTDANSMAGKSEKDVSATASKSTIENVNKKDDVSKIVNDVKALGVDDDMDMIPVRDRSNEGSNGGNKVETGGAISNDKIIGAAVTEEHSSEYNTGDELSEQDLKTPVNVNDSSSDSQSFILPTPPSGEINSQPEALDPNDRQVLVYYTEQMNSHSTLLGNAIDAFIGAIDSKQPPNVFISHSKFVIVSAHKLVHIGDSIHRNLISNNVSARIMHCANHLCDCLKASVTATKTAALQYPSVPAIQDMMDKVIAVSHAAHELKLIITQAARQ